MARLLYLEASPRKERSASIAVAKAFVEEYRKTHPATRSIRSIFGGRPSRNSMGR